jgi:WD40 repeat protein
MSVRRPLVVVVIGGLLVFLLAALPSAALAPPAGQKKPLVDRYGDPLPQGATARLGTVRLREGKEIDCIAYSPDGKILASGGQDGVVRFWDAKTGKELRRFEGHHYREYHVHSVAFSPNGRWMASGTAHVIHLWDLSSGKTVRKLGKDMGGIYQLMFSPDSKMLLSSTGDGRTRLWNVDNGVEEHRFEDALSMRTPCTMAGSQIITGGFPVLVCDLKTGKVIRKLDLLREGVHSLAAMADGTRLAVGSGKIIYLFDLATGKEVRRLTGHDGDAITGLAFTPEGKALVSTSGDHTIRVWDVDSGKEKHRIKGWDTARTVVMAPDGKTFATIGPFNCIRLWDTATGKERVLAEGHHDRVLSLAFLDHGKKLVTGSEDGTVRLWDVAGAREVRRLLDVPHRIDVVAVSPDERWIAASGYCQKVHLFAAPGGKSVHELEDARGGGLAFSPDSKLLACGGPDATIELRDVVTGGKLLSMKGHQYDVHALAFSPNGKLLASSTLLDRTLLFWDTTTGKQVRKIDGDLGALQSLVFTPDGKWLIAEGRSFFTTL